MYIQNFNVYRKMINYCTPILSLLNPFKLLQTPFISYNSSPTSLIVMVPPKGGFISKQATNKVNPPGCSITASTTTKPDGSVETRETLTCTKVIIQKPSGKCIK
nr:hypothetical protein [Gracilaria tikvahiae]